MSKKQLMTTFPVMTDRYTPIEQYLESVRAIAASGQVDQLLLWDQLVSFFAPQLWKPDIAPMAAMVPDLDSYSDPFAMACLAGSVAPDLSLAISTDAIRRGPAEIMQSMMTVARTTNRGATLMMGAGEYKQTKPYGRKRSVGLKTLEDQLQLFSKIWDSSGPIDFEGNHVHFDGAYIGNARPEIRPEIWALGGGPMLLEMATSYADGLSTAAPFAFPTPEKFGAMVSDLKDKLARKGRDPEDFRFDFWAICLVHDNPETLEKAYANPLLKWMAAIFGRSNHGDWTREGIQSPMPDDWHYAMKLLPVNTPDEEVQRVVDGVSREMAEKSWFTGSPEEVAARIQAYIDAGANGVTLCDMLPTILEPEDAMAGFNRDMEVLRILKENNP